MPVAVRSTVVLSLCVLPLLSACGGGEDGPYGPDTPVVRVGGHVITAGDLRAFESRLPESLGASGNTEDRHREHLQSLVDRQLLLLEARARGLDTLAAVRHTLLAGEEARLVAGLLREEVHDRVTVTRADMERDYEEFDLGWQVWPAHIRLATEEEAWQVIEELESGADFASLARDRSMADDAAEGGDLKRYFGRHGMVPALREGIMDLPEGAISRPIRTKDGYEVLTIIRRRRESLQAMEGRIIEHVKRAKLFKRRAEYLEELSARWQVEYHGEQAPEALRLLRQEGPAGPQAGGAALVSIGERQLSAASCATVLRSQSRTTAADSASLFAVIDRWVLPDTLLVLEARALGRDREPAFQAWRRQRLEELMVRKLYALEVAPNVTVVGEDVHQYYEANLEQYRVLPGPIHLTEVLVDTREKAERVLAEARSGVPLEELAVRHSTRPEMAPVGGHAMGDSGHMYIHPRYSSPYREALGDANTRDVGRIQGPMEVQEKHSIFRLDQAYERTAPPFKQVRGTVLAQIRREREAPYFTEFMEGLRSKYRDVVEWHEADLSLIGRGAA